MTLGAWHILPRKHTFPTPYQPNEAQTFGDQQLKTADRVYLYFHGNAGNRATGHRTLFYKMLTSYSNAHLLAVDYRGFGDSSPILPTEETLCLDSLAAYQWLINKGVDPEKIIITGHSLGSGIATHLAKHLSVEQGKFGGLLLLSGYSSLPDAAIGYSTVPLLKPFEGQLSLELWLKSKITQKWPSFSNIRAVKRPVLLIHGLRDRDIGPWQSKALFLESMDAKKGSNSVEPHYANLRSGSFDPNSQNITVYASDAGQVWHTSTTWLLLVKHAGHNTLAKHLIVDDTISHWSRTW